MDHWKQLAEELGAEIPPEEPEQATSVGEVGTGDAPRGEDVAASGPPSAPPKPALPPRPAPPRRTASDWARLAEELGIEVPPEPEPEPAPVGEVGPAEDATVSPVEEPAPRHGAGAESEPQREETRRRPDESVRDEDRRGRRRRRRRRAPADAEAHAVEPAAASDVLPEDEDRELAFADEELMLPEAEPGEFDEADELGHEEESSDSAAIEASDRRREEDGGRTRGHRRRRRKSAAARRETPESPSETREPVADRAGGTAPAASPVSPSESLDDELDADDGDFEDEDAEHHADKSLHRGIPSWYEAVNLVVSVNLESRAKNPDRKGSGRARGGQDRRGRDRNRSNS